TLFDGQSWTAQQSIYGGIQAIAIDESEKVWVGSGSAVHRFDGEEAQNYTLNDGFATAIAIDPLGYVWVGSTAGVSVLVE
ncbi:MAG: hypothetical protein KDJ65_09400, partial [Anaerolineae bacterium]|nr:hypothetical protein [Anaerolineae bacterium]